MMTRRNFENGSNEQKAVSLHDDVGRLVQIAGPRATMSAETLDRMQSRLRPLWQEQVEAQAPARSWLRPLAAAAVLVVAVTAGLVGRGLWLQKAVTFDVVRVVGSASTWPGSEAGSITPLDIGAALGSGQSVATAGNSLLALETASGHSLRLDAQTRIALFSGREVRLEQGAIYIESAVDGDRDLQTGDGLSVLTPFGRVDEIGTQFEVRLSSDSLTVRVREGEVELNRRGVIERAVAGEAIYASAVVVRKSAVDPYAPVFDWTQRVVPGWPLDGKKLGEFLRWAARQTGYVLAYQEPAIESEASVVILKGDIEGLAPSEALDAVLPAVGLTHRVEDGVLLISRDRV